MREIIRLLAFTVVTFVITALAVILSNPDLSQSIRQRLGLAEAPVVDPSARLTEGKSVVRVYRPSLGTWLGLSGFPSDTTLRFPFPDTSLIERAQLQLDLETQMLEQGQARVRVLLNGTAHDTILLKQGRHDETLTYNLLPIEYGNPLVVSIEGTGTTAANGNCPADVMQATAEVEVLESSSLMLQLNTEALDAHTRVVLSPDPLPLASTDDPAFAVWAQQWLEGHGVATALAQASLPQAILLHEDGPQQVMLNDNGRIDVSGAQGLAQLMRWRGGSLPDAYQEDWPLPAIALADRVGVQVFHGGQRWDMPYELADLPGGRVPTGLHLALETSVLPEGDNWTMRLLLNGRTVHHSEFPGDGALVTTDIALPTDGQGLANMLTLMLSNDAAAPQGCVRPPTASARVLPQTTLLSEQDGALPAQILVQQLAGASSVAVTAVTDLGGQHLLVLRDLLGLVMPLEVPVDFSAESDAPVRIALLSDDGIAALGPADQLALDKAAYLVLPGSGSGGSGAKVLDLNKTTGTVARAASGAQSALLVTW